MHTCKKGGWVVPRSKFGEPNKFEGLSFEWHFGRDLEVKLRRWNQGQPVRVLACTKLITWGAKGVARNLVDAPNGNPLFQDL